GQTRELWRAGRELVAAEYPLPTARGSVRAPQTKTLAGASANVVALKVRRPPTLQKRQIELEGTYGSLHRLARKRWGQHGEVLQDHALAGRARQCWVDLS